MHRTVAAFFLATALLPAAQASLTPVNSSGSGNGVERCLAGTFCAGGGYAGAPSILMSYAIDRGIAFSSLQRVDDALDRSWMKTSSAAAARPIARYAGDQSQLGLSSSAGLSIVTPVLPNFSVAVEHPGLFAGSVHAGDFVQLSSIWAGLPGAVGAPFSFVLKDLTTSLLLTSNTARPGFSNTGYTQDWMVTWKVAGQDRYLIAWEDRLNIGGNGLPNDWDYNDYVLEVSGVAPYSMTGQGDPSAVPLPPALGLMLGGIALLGGATRRRAARP